MYVNKLRGKITKFALNKIYRNIYTYLNLKRKFTDSHRNIKETNDIQVTTM